MRVGIDASAMLIARKNGYENYATSLILALANLSDDQFEGLEIFLYLYAGNVLADKALIKEYLPILRRFTTRIHRLKQGYSYSLAWWSRLDRLDLLHMPVYIFQSPLKCKVVTTFHDACGVRAIKDGVTIPEIEAMREYINKQIAISDAFIAISKNSKKDMQTLYNIPEHRIGVVYHGVSNAFHPNQDAATEVKKFYDLPPYLLSVNALQGNKNYCRLFQAYAELRMKYHIPHVLVVVGREGWGAGDVFSELERLHLGEAVRMIGYVPQEHLIGLYSGASLVVNGSLCEGFGLPVLEALACGAIVAVAQNTSLPEVGGSAVACFDPLDIYDMVEVIYTALTDERLRQTLRSASTAQVSKFTWTQTALNTLSIYKGNGIVYK